MRAGARSAGMPPPRHAHVQAGVWSVDMPSNSRSEFEFNSIAFQVPYLSSRTRQACGPWICPSMRSWRPAGASRGMGSAGVRESGSRVPCVGIPGRLLLTPGPSGAGELAEQAPGPRQTADATVCWCRWPSPTSRNRQCLQFVGAAGPRQPADATVNVRTQEAIEVLAVCWCRWPPPTWSRAPRRRICHVVPRGVLASHGMLAL